MARYIELQWTCSSCGTRNPGRRTTCEACNNPKDGTERYDMPADTRRAPTVTDPELLDIARGGSNWRCGACGSDQRRSDGRCLQCGAAPEAPHRPSPRARRRVRTAWPLRIASAVWPLLGPTLGLGLLGFAVASVACCVGLPFVLRPPPSVVPAEVVGASWTTRVEVERLALRPAEGFAESRPSDAQDVRSLGRAVHHHEQVFDHMDHQTWTEQVPDGFDTKVVTERVACGEDCVGRPRSCREVCTPTDNGFARCDDVCTGGGQRCTTRYCDQNRTEKIPKYRTEQRSREVPVYRQEPRYAERFAWRARRWGHDRTVEAKGEGPEPRWPSDDEVALGRNLGAGEEEREQRTAAYTLDAKLPDGRRATWRTASPEDWVRYARASHVCWSKVTGAPQSVAPVAAGQPGPDPLACVPPR